MSGPLRILIVGNAGQVGVELELSFQGCGEVIGVDRESFDLAQEDQVRALVRRVAPDVILNAAAYTAVDRAESEPELAWSINADAARILAEEALSRNALLVHYSTDYVFNGAKLTPWTEEDAPAPLNAYGAGKLAGEQAITKVGGRYLVFRTSWVYGPHGSNFLLTMLRLARQRDTLSIVGDQIGSPTTSIELARATRAVTDQVISGNLGAASDWAGLYHMTCSGATSWCGFAQAIFAHAGKLLDGKLPVVTPIATEEYPTPAKRPRNSVLSNAKLEARFGLRLAPWETALDEVIEALS
jgi:dTDP-4-dehydrorhamnose reductase